MEAREGRLLADLRRQPGDGVDDQAGLQHLRPEELLDPLPRPPPIDLGPREYPVAALRVGASALDLARPALHEHRADDVRHVSAAAHLEGSCTTPGPTVAQRGGERGAVDPAGVAREARRWRVLEVLSDGSLLCKGGRALRCAHRQGRGGWYGCCCGGGGGWCCCCAGCCCRHGGRRRGCAQVTVLVMQRRFRSRRFRSRKRFGTYGPPCRCNGSRSDHAWQRHSALRAVEVLAGAGEGEHRANT